MDKETIVRFITLMGLDNEKSINEEMLDGQYEKLKTACIGEDEKLKEISEAYEALRENIDSANIILGAWESSTAVKPVKPEKKGGRAWKIAACVCAVVLVCLLAVKVIGGNTGDNKPAETDTPAEVSTEETAAAIAVPRLDYEKMYALHEPDELVMTIGDEAITWEDYFSWVYMNAMQVENYFAQAAMYNMPLGWSDSIEEGMSYADYVPFSTESNIAQLVAIEKMAEARGLVKDADFEAILAEQTKSDIATVCGEEAGEEEFAAKLAETYMSRKSYDRMNSANAAYDRAFILSYGEQLEKIADEDVLAFLNENGYMYASHILLMTSDAEGNALDDAAKAELKQQLEELRTELAAIEDEQELVSRFAELKAEHDEDTGKTAYPNGYLFRSGEMVPEFEQAVLSLEDYGLSEIVETSYGYHLIIRLPLDPEAVMGYNNDGTTYSPRVAYANQDYNGDIRETLAALDIKYAEGYETLDVSEFVK